MISAVLIPLAVRVDVRYAFLLFVLVMAYGLLVLPRLRARATAAVTRRTARWKLDAE